MAKVPKTTREMETSNAEHDLKNIRRALRHELEVEERKRVATREPSAKRARKRERKAVNAPKEARAHPRRQGEEEVAVMRRNRGQKTESATATTEGTRLRMHHDTYEAAEVAAKERKRKLLDVLAACGIAPSSQGYAARSWAAQLV